MTSTPAGDDADRTFAASLFGGPVESSAELDQQPTEVDPDSAEAYLHRLFNPTQSTERKGTT